MLRGLFGSGPRVRVFLQPGAALSKEVLRAHRLRHTPALAEHRAGQTTNFIVFSDGTSNGDAAAQAMLASAEGDFQATQQWFDRHPEIAGDFNQTEQDWWASGHSDHVNDNSAGDTDQLASGCGDLFLYYLRSQLTFDWPSICSAGGSTLGACYRSLTGYEPAQ